MVIMTYFGKMMLTSVLIIGLVGVVSTQPLIPAFHFLLPHPQQYSFVMQQLFDLRSQIRDCRGHLVCDVKSVSDQYKTDVTCVERTQICDTLSNCPNHVDETGCPILCHGKIRCRDDCTCARACDGHRECPDGEDERSCGSQCTCGPGMYLCRDGTTCIQQNKICDGTVDCRSGGDDEEGCPSRCNCPPNTYQCISGDKCIGTNLICNGVNDCDDGDDEMDCSVGCGCQPGQFYCANGLRCISANEICQGSDANECCLDVPADCPGMLNEDMACPPPTSGGG